MPTIGVGHGSAGLQLHGRAVAQPARRVDDDRLAALQSLQHWHAAAFGAARA